MPAPRCLERLKDQTEHRLKRYKIKRTNTGLYRLWRLYDEWKPVQEFASHEAAEEYLMGKLPAIESEL
jgi:hypothetical protein